MVDESVLAKSGEIIGMFKLSRASREHGLSVTAKMDPVIEDFFRAEETVPVRQCGREWICPTDLRVYVPNLIRQPLALPGGAGTYTLDRPGKSLILQPEHFDEDSPMPAAGSTAIINLSFLRIVGISEGNGVTFQLKGVMSTDAVVDTTRKLRAALRQFYLDYIAGVEMSVQMVTQEYRR